jgi:hypothetical protein
MNKDEEILTIKEMMVKIGLDPDHIVRIEYRKSQIYLKEIIKKTESTLINIQEVDGMEVISERQKSVQLTLNRLLFAFNKMVEMEGIIYALREQNELLTERLNLRK